MASTIRIESFKKINIRERTVLTEDALAGDTVVHVESAAGYQVDQPIYVGALSREGCERAAVASVVDETTINLAEPLKLAHRRYDAVTGVLGDRIRIYRASNVNDQPPAAEAFAVLGSRAIDADQPNTFYTDSTGSADYWYKATYWNETTLEETSLDLADPMRGDDYGRYAHLDEIRTEAGFKNSTNLADYVIDQKRRAAESEINAALASRYKVPFKPVPEIIHTLTVQLAAGLLAFDQFGDSMSRKKLDDARAQLKQYAVGDGSITDEDGENVSNVQAVRGYPDSSAPRMFSVNQRF